MPVSSAYLVKLQPDVTVDFFLRALFASELRDYVHIASRVREPVIRPETLDVVFFNCHQWDVLLFLGPGPHDLLKEGGARVQSLVSQTYSVACGIPSGIWNNYHKRSAELNAQARSVPVLANLTNPARTDAHGGAPSTSQNLEVSDQLLDFAERLTTVERHTGPVSQLNLLHFRAGKEATESYHEYGKRFPSIASRHGGDPKLVGIIPSPALADDSRGRRDLPKEEWWNEISLVHYP